MSRQLRDDLTASEARRLLDYDPATGVFIWRHRDDAPKERNTRWAGKEAGSARYNPRRKVFIVTVSINAVHYLAHRLAWLYVYGVWPSFEIDHEDQNPLNNRIGNLRPATHPQNAWNISAHRDNKLGVKGVSLDADGDYHAEIMVHGQRHRKRFPTLLEAKAWREQKALELHGDFAPKTKETV